MGKRDVVKKNRNKQKKQDLIIIGIIAVLAVGIIAAIVISKLPKPVAAVNVTPKPMENGLNLGDPNAPVKVIEFADFQCPYCQLYWQQIEPTIISNYVTTKKVYYTYSPMAFLGADSISAAEAAYCANDQGKFWEYRDYMLSNYTGENTGDYTQAHLITFAQKLNLDMTSFKDCLTSGKYKQKVDDANNYANKQGINSTPSFLVNGKQVSATDLQSTIESALAGK